MKSFINSVKEHYNDVPRARYYCEELGCHVCSKELTAHQLSILDKFAMDNPGPFARLRKLAQLSWTDENGTPLIKLAEFDEFSQNMPNGLLTKIMGNLGLLQRDEAELLMSQEKNSSPTSADSTSS